ncbi:DUF1758 domain-containing protein [Trichonephila inaurata madagascariensis]|uniref:DUF1758 domain-containing protein n=1 Tax=Trichonephila inaurata madagascariensis TaxID=2747483 RepID=A0A8X6Y1W7_9ARAC|nr:DUF1758 domain-containing protein [Trichonephila inaurata madagascariensis]GFY64525.1 DUF1758 domain-containing protein [Trichonephila inaurata madagascariensis]
MNVTPLKAQRKALRTSFTCSAKQTDDDFDKENPDSKQLFILKVQLNDQFQRLEKCQNEMIDLIFKDENAEQLFETDFLSAGKYRDRFTELCTKTDQLATKEMSEIVTSQGKFKLPKIELKKFSGDAKEYLTFLIQFRKVNEDSSIPPEDKFQYLL